MVINLSISIQKSAVHGTKHELEFGKHALLRVVFIYRIPHNDFE